MARTDTAGTFVPSPNGWTVIKRRSAGDAVIDLGNENEMENGLGAPNGRFWLGAKYVHYLTSLPNHLERVALRIMYESGGKTLGYYLPEFQLKSNGKEYTFDDKGGAEKWFRFQSNGEWTSISDVNQAPSFSKLLTLQGENESFGSVLYEIARFNKD